MQLNYLASAKLKESYGHLSYNSVSGEGLLSMLLPIPHLHSTPLCTQEAGPPWSCHPSALFLWRPVGFGQYQRAG